VSIFWPDRLLELRARHGIKELKGAADEVDRLSNENVRLRKALVLAEMKLMTYRTDYDPDLMKRIGLALGRIESVPAKRPRRRRAEQAPRLVEQSNHHKNGA
jgi:hypothetical protein